MNAYDLNNKAEGGRPLTRREVEQIIQTALAERYRPFKLFGLRGTRDYAQRVAQQMGKSLTPHTELAFEDGEWSGKSESPLQSG